MKGNSGHFTDPCKPHAFIQHSDMIRKQLYWFLSLVTLAYGLLSQVNQAISNLNFLRSIPGWHSVIAMLFSGGRVLTGPAIFLGGTASLTLACGAIWNAISKRRHQSIPSRPNYDLQAFKAIEYIAFRSRLSSTFNTNHWILATAAFMNVARSGRIRLGGRRPDQTEILDITAEELSSLQPMAHYLPREGKITVGPINSPFSLINLAGDKILFESVVCDSREIAAAWPLQGIPDDTGNL